MARRKPGSVLRHHVGQLCLDPLPKAINRRNPLTGTTLLRLRPPVDRGQGLFQLMPLQIKTTGQMPAVVPPRSEPLVDLLKLFRTRMTRRQLALRLPVIDDVAVEVSRVAAEPLHNRRFGVSVVLVVVTRRGVFDACVFGRRLTLV